jgi:hypothetical protein
MWFFYVAEYLLDRLVLLMERKGYLELRKEASQ